MESIWTQESTRVDATELESANVRNRSKSSYYLQTHRQREMKRETPRFEASILQADGIPLGSCPKEVEYLSEAKKFLAKGKRRRFHKSWNLLFVQSGGFNKDFFSHLLG